MGRWPIRFPGAVIRGQKAAIERAARAPRLSQGERERRALEADAASKARLVVVYGRRPDEKWRPIDSEDVYRLGRELHHIARELIGRSEDEELRSWLLAEERERRERNFRRWRERRAQA